MKACHVARDDLFQAFEEIYNSSHLSEGQYVKKFEHACEDLYNAPALATTNAGSALFNVMSNIDYWQGSYIVANNTFFATGAMCQAAGIDVILADVGEDFCLTVETIKEAARGRHVAGVILTHVGGPLATEYEDIAELCRKNGWMLVEDAAHAFGVKDKGLRAGMLSEAAVFSFYPTKAIPAGEGGLIVTNNPDLAERCARFRNYGKWVDKGRINYTGSGFNLRMDEWTAAVAYLQTVRLGELLERRAECAEKIQRIIPLHPAFEGRVTNWYKYITTADVPLKKTAGKVYAISDQLKTAMKIGGFFPMSEYIAKTHQCVPLHEGMYDGMSEDDMIKELLK